VGSLTSHNPIGLHDLPDRFWAPPSLLADLSPGLKGLKYEDDLSGLYSVFPEGNGVANKTYVYKGFKL
jgi:hypothetical protein